MDPQIKLLVSTLAAPFRIILLAAFLLAAKMGYLTPEGATQLTNSIMDALVVIVPAGYAIWAGFKAWRVQVAAALANRPESIVAKAAALPEVGRIIATPDIVAKLDDPNVTTR